MKNHKDNGHFIDENKHHDEKNKYFKKDCHCKCNDCNECNESECDNKKCECGCKDCICNAKPKGHCCD